MTLLALESDKNIQKFKIFFKTLIFQIWLIWITLWLRWFISEIFFLKLTYLNSLNIFTLQMAHIGAKKLDLGVLSPRKMDQSGKSLKFLKNFSTFWLIAQLSDVTASQDRLEMKAETKTFPTHSVRAHKNVYLIN